MELRLPKHYICTVRSHEQTDIELKLGTLDDRHKFGIKALLDSSLSEMELKPATLKENLLSVLFLTKQYSFFVTIDASFMHFTKDRQAFFNTAIDVNNSAHLTGQCKLLPPSSHFHHLWVLVEQQTVGMKQVWLILEWRHGKVGCGMEKGSSGRHVRGRSCGYLWHTRSY